MDDDDMMIDMFDNGMLLVDGFDASYGAGSYVPVTYCEDVTVYDDGSGVYLGIVD
jgi:hypothetical protein